MPPLAAWAQTPVPKIVAYVELALQNGDLATAQSVVSQFRRINGDTPEALEALSWVARGELAAGNSSEALKTAREIERIAQTSLATRKLDQEPHLPLALGAALEIEGKVLVDQGQRAQALRYYRAALRTWTGTSLAERLQKNINVLTLGGRPMPALAMTDWIGPKPPRDYTFRGKPLLLFFWAHWCPDCKADAPVISKLASEFAGRGLMVIAPTRLYGYTAEDENAAPAVERAFIQKAFDRYYANIPGVIAPLGSANFDRFGASTTPTIVLVNASGLVDLYHPGAMDEASLRSALEQLVASPRVIRRAAAAPNSTR